VLACLLTEKPLLYSGWSNAALVFFALCCCFRFLSSPCMRFLYLTLLTWSLLYVLATFMLFLRLCPRLVVLPSTSARLGAALAESAYSSADAACRLKRWLQASATIVVVSLRYTSRHCLVARAFFS
jgi:hypothetical protein